MIFGCYVIYNTYSLFYLRGVYLSEKGIEPPASGPKIISAADKDNSFQGSIVTRKSDIHISAPVSKSTATVIAESAKLGRSTVGFHYLAIKPPESIFALQLYHCWWLQKYKDKFVNLDAASVHECTIQLVYEKMHEMMRGGIFTSLKLQRLVTTGNMADKGWF